MLPRWSASTGSAPRTRSRAEAHMWGNRLRGVLGATPIAGEVLPEFRWVMFHVGTAVAGGRIEGMEPVAGGFLQRFLDRHGEGPHHATFMVDDLRATVQQVRDLGAQVVREDYGHAPWQEAFVFPAPRHGVVIQLAQSDRDYPTPEELLASSTRHPDRYPASRDASEVTWRHHIWATPAGPGATLIQTRFASTDPAHARALLEGVLGGEHRVDGAWETYSWPGGILRLTHSAPSGVRAIDLDEGDPSLWIGDVRLAPPT